MADEIRTDEVEAEERAAQEKADESAAKETEKLHKKAQMTFLRNALYKEVQASSSKMMHQQYAMSKKYGFPPIKLAPV